MPYDNIRDEREVLEAGGNRGGDPEEPQPARVVKMGLELRIHDHAAHALREVRARKRGGANPKEGAHGVSHNKDGHRQCRLQQHASKEEE